MLSIAIVGLPNVGKSTLFNALTNKRVASENYPFCTIEPNVGVVSVPDPRLEKIAAISRPAKIVPAAVEFVDIAGLVRGASQGEGLGNQFLANIRECDAICQVVRYFEDSRIIHVESQINPISDQETINLELILADLVTVGKRLDKVSREAKTGEKTALAQQEFLTKLNQQLETGRPARELTVNDEEKAILQTLQLLSAKPMLIVANADDHSSCPTGVLPLNIKLEAEIAALPTDEQKLYLADFADGQSGLDKLIRAAYELLGLASFFTTGTDETKAWTIHRHSPAPVAAGVIHTDFIAQFIRAQVIDWAKFVEAGSESRAKELGWLRTEGRDYLVQDGDICHFLLNN